MVRREGFEPPTHALEGHCSIQLSYRRTPIFTAEHRKNQKAAYYRVSPASSTSVQPQFKLKLCVRAESIQTIRQRTCQ